MLLGDGAGRGDAALAAAEAASGAGRRGEGFEKGMGRAWEGEVGTILPGPLETQWRLKNFARAREWPRPGCVWGLLASRKLGW